MNTVDREVETSLDVIYRVVCQMRDSRAASHSDVARAIRTELIRHNAYHIQRALAHE